MGGFRWIYNFVLLIFLTKQNLANEINVTTDENGPKEANNSTVKDARGHYHLHRLTKKHITDQTIGKTNNDDYKRSILCYPELNPDDNIVVIDRNNRLYEGMNNEVCGILTVKTNHYRKELAIGRKNWLRKAMDNLCSKKYEPGVLVTIYDTITHKKITGRNSIVCKYKNNDDEDDDVKISRKSRSVNHRYMIPDSKERSFNDYLRRQIASILKAQDSESKSESTTVEDESE